MFVGCQAIRNQTQWENNTLLMHRWVILSFPFSSVSLELHLLMFYFMFLLRSWSLCHFWLFFREARISVYRNAWWHVMFSAKDLMFSNDKSITRHTRKRDSLFCTLTLYHVIWKPIGVYFRHHTMWEAVYNLPDPLGILGIVSVLIILELLQSLSSTAKHFSLAES